jgi:hypothetical protein
MCGLSQDNIRSAMINGKQRFEAVIQEYSDSIQHHFLEKIPMYNIEKGRCFSVSFQQNDIKLFCTQT